MKACILGSGRIGRGFITQIMKLNHVDLIFFDVNEEIVSKLNNNSKYIIHVLGHSDQDLVVDNIISYSMKNINKLAECWSQSDFLFTACGGKNMEDLGKTLAAAFKKMYAEKKVHITNIVTCENWIHPAKALRESIINELTEEEKSSFLEHTGIGEAVILCTGTGAPDPTKQVYEMDTWIQDFKYLPMDKKVLKGTIPKWDYVEFVEDFGDLLTQKLYTNNTSCASIAYLGSLLGETYLAEAANNSIIFPLLDNIYNEINQTLILGMGIDAENQYKFSARAKAKYTDVDIVDPVTRIARDPLRKLAPNDRLIGPAQMALSVGVKPKTIALCTAAALFYSNPKDESACQLERMRKEKGISYVLKNICKLKPNEELFKMIINATKELKKNGWLKEEIKW